MGATTHRVTTEHLRCATTVEGLEDLFTLLGYQPEGLSLAPEDHEAWGLLPEGLPPIRSARVLASHGCLLVLHVSLHRDDAASFRKRLCALRGNNPAQPVLMAATSDSGRSLRLGTWGAGRERAVLKQVLIHPSQPYASDLDVLEDMRVLPGAGPHAQALRIETALDRKRVTRRFFLGFRKARLALAAAMSGLPQRSKGARYEREQLALLILVRLLFLYFLQRKGWLHGDPLYLARLRARCRKEGTPFFRALQTLFFGVLNTPRKDRAAEALALGDFPYLNGGLFEPDLLEVRHSRLFIPDEAFTPALDDLFERYRFTACEVETRGDSLAVDPAMLGQVFESLMEPERRGESGTFYTPPSLVDQMIDTALDEHLQATTGLPSTGTLDSLSEAQAHQALKALETVTLLDPACGSGAFLLGALHRLEQHRRQLSRRLGLPLPPRVELRREILCRNLHGVDKDAAAVRLCALRMWLSLVVEAETPEDLHRVPPLPNLDHKLRQGDSLLSIWDLPLRGPSATPGATPDLARRLGLLHRKYESASGQEKRQLQTAMRDLERELALGHIRRQLHIARQRQAGLRGLQRTKDLFGHPLRVAASIRSEAAEVRKELRRLTRLEKDVRRGSTAPVFGYPIHFPAMLRKGGFDIILGNPPWVRVHRIPRGERRSLLARYRVHQDAGWSRGASLSRGNHGFARQMDLAGTFVERSGELLRPGGIAALLVPSKLLRSLYGSGVRELLHREWSVRAIHDLSQVGRGLFEADTFPLLLVARKGPPPGENEVRIRVRAAPGKGIESVVPSTSLPLIPGDSGSPWVLASRETRAALTRMQSAGPPLAEGDGPHVPRMGIKTGWNAAYIPSEVGHRPGKRLVHARMADSVSPVAGVPVRFEARYLRPLLRGQDVSAWSVSASKCIVVPHDLESGAPLLRLPAHLRSHFERLESRLAARPGAPRGTPWALPASLGDARPPLVCWSDIGRRLEVCPVTGPIEGPLGPGLPIPLNTVQYLPVATEDQAHLLAALLNSTPVRAFLASFAPRAKDHHLRYLCWVVGLIPWPAGATHLDRGPATDLVSLSRRFAAGALIDQAALDSAACALYSLTPAHLASLSSHLALVTGHPAPPCKGPRKNNSTVILARTPTWRSQNQESRAKAPRRKGRKEEWRLDVGATPGARRQGRHG